MKNFFSSAPGKIIILFVSFILIATASYFWFFRKKEIKRELIASVYVIPNDTSETKIKILNELELTIPKGELKQPDSLLVFNVMNVTKPENTEDILKVYDFSFGKTNKFKKPLTIEISYEEITGGKKIENEKCLHLMSYDEKNNKWSEVDAELITEKKQLVFYAEHFSSYGVVYDIAAPHPLMKVGTWKRPSTLNSTPDIFASQKILETSAGGNPSQEAENSGYRMVEEAFNFTSAFTSLAEELGGTEIFEKFNKFAGEFGLLLSLKQFAFEIIEGKTDEARLNLCKNLTMYSLGKWGNQALRISNIGVFFIDYSLTKFGEKGAEVREKKYRDIYENYNRNHNVYKKDKSGWVNFILGVVGSSGDIRSAVDTELNRYLYACFNEEGSIIPEDVEEILVNNERVAVLEILNDALHEAAIEIDENRKKEILGVMGKMKDLLNTEFPITVIVAGDENEIKGLPVRIKITGPGQELWEGKTDNAGQWWGFRCTWLGYLYYKKPTVVELEYDGKILSENFTATNRGVTVRFYLPKKEKKEKNAIDPDKAAGTYSGIMTLKVPGYDWKIKGNCEIVITKELKATFTATLEGTNNLLDGSVQHTKLVHDMSGYLKHEGDSSFVKLLGTYNQTVVTTLKGQTYTKDFPNIKWQTYLKFDGEKLFMPDSPTGSALLTKTR